jgi:hypothetical protein
MGLYRNIAGFLDNRKVGLSLLDTPTITLLNPPGGDAILPSPFTDPVAYQEQQQDMTASYEAEMKSRYDYLLTTSLSDLTTAGYYVENNGSIFHWENAEKTTSTAFLPLDWLQKIENERGTPGALLLHMQQPDLAKDTAGYEGGTSGTWYAENGVDPTTQVVTDPIPAVQTLPDVQTTAPATTVPVPTTQLPTTTTTTNNFLPLALLAGLGVVAVPGDKLLHEKRKIVFAGGVAALFYIMSKRT